MKSRFLTVATLVAATVAIAACSLDSRRGGTLRQQLGLAQGAPDEFLIIARAPIEIPSSFDLPRPEPGAPSRVEVNPLSDAHNALFLRPEPVRLGAASGGEQVLLSGANAEGDNSVVRDILAERGEGLDGNPGYLELDQIEAQMAAAARSTYKTYAHHVCHQGGRIVICKVVASLVQTPSALLALTLKV